MLHETVVQALWIKISVIEAVYSFQYLVVKDFFECAKINMHQIVYPENPLNLKNKHVILMMILITSN